MERSGCVASLLLLVAGVQTPVYAQGENMQLILASVVSKDTQAPTSVHVYASCVGPGVSSR